MITRLRHRIFRVMEDELVSDKASWTFNTFMVVLIVANVAAVAAETVKSLDEAYGAAFFAFEVFSVAVFTIEYVLRLWVSTDHPPVRHHGPVLGRLRFALGPFLLIDLLAIAPFYLSLLFPVADLRILRIFRLLRLFKLARYSPALASITRVIIDERRALGAALIIMLALMVLSAAAIYHVEHEHQPEVFSSIPAAMWWSLATLTTVGFGDHVPVTEIGRMIGGVVMIFGLGMAALPVAIIASGFSKEIHRREFVVSFSMVAEVPIFSHLDAASIADIARILHARQVAAGTVILREGEPPDCMYFIASGRVEVHLHPEPIELEAGDFFGEIALLDNRARTATVRAITNCRLLVLERADFQVLMETEDSLYQAIKKAAKGRLDGLEKGRNEKPGGTTP